MASKWLIVVCLCAAVAAIFGFLSTTLEVNRISVSRFLSYRRNRVIGKSGFQVLFYRAYMISCNDSSSITDR